MSDLNRQKRIRTSEESSLFNYDELDFSDFIKPYVDFEQEYKSFVEERRKKKLGKAYLVSYTDEPELIYISFATNKDKAKSKAVLFYREFHPNFIGEGWMQKFRNSRTKRVPDLDKFAEQGTVPIPELLKLGAVFRCSCCGNYTFNYEDYQNKRCFVIEEGENPFPFVRGNILCYNCHKRYMGS